MSKNSEMKQQKGKVNNFIMLPNILLKLDLTPCALIVYLGILKICCGRNSFYMSKKNFCEQVNISERTFMKAKKELSKKREELNGLPLVEIHKQKTKINTSLPDLIIITDIWKENSEFFENSKKVSREQNLLPRGKNLPPNNIRDKNMNKTNNNNINNTEASSDEPALVSSTKEKIEEKPTSFDESDNSSKLNKVEYAKKVANFLSTSEYRTDFRGVLSWIKRFGIERVKQAMAVFIEELKKSETDPSRSTIPNRGGYFYTLLTFGRVEEGKHFLTNRDYAKYFCGLYPQFLEFTKNYVKIRYNHINEEISYRLNTETFLQLIQDYISRCMVHSESLEFCL